MFLGSIITFLLCNWTPKILVKHMTTISFWVLWEAYDKVQLDVKEI